MIFFLFGWNEIAEQQLLRSAACCGTPVDQ
jgi:hypothetical protein